MADLRRVSHGMFAVDAVAVASSGTDGFHVAGFDEVGEDALGCALSDTDVLGDVAEPDIGCLGKAQENLGVVGEEGPGLRSIRT